MYNIIHNKIINTKETLVCLNCIKNWKCCKYKKPIKTRNFTTKHHKNESERINYANIQMLSPGLYKQLFKYKQPSHVDSNTCEKVKLHLEKHNLWGKTSTIVENIDFDLPQLQGENLDDHFNIVATEIVKEYKNLAEHMANKLSTLPIMPEKWQMSEGWTKYNNSGTFEKVNAPDEDVLIFDVEVCMSIGDVPVLATAVSKSAWYCWVSDVLIQQKCSDPIKKLTPSLMIPLGTSNKKRLIIGHNVCFDRSFVREQYSLEASNLRFLDTLSLHVCVSGITNEQRNYIKSKSDSKVHFDWMDVGAMNSLVKVYEFYCNKSIDKSSRDYFVTGSLQDIYENFQECARYCAVDVQSTHAVFTSVWPMFCFHAPHPVTLLGMLEMGTSYLPIDESWNHYLEQAEFIYNKMAKQMRHSLMAVADEALKMIIDDKYKSDPWLWSMDWSIHKTAISKDNVVLIDKEDDVHTYIKNRLNHLSEKRRNQLHLPGYPNWYRKLCMSPGEESYQSGPQSVSSQTRVTPLLLRMTWDGYPLHHEREYGWGFLVPCKSISNKKNTSSTNEAKSNFPMKSFLEIIRKRKLLLGNTEGNVLDEEAGIDIGIPGVLFHRLPHKNGNDYNVGNPLAKDFLNKIEDGTLATSSDYNAKEPIELNMLLSFWRNGRKRIMSQKTVWFDDGRGVILPQVVTAGTVTRRSVEATWLTASNPMFNRIGSELKSLIRTPPGYVLVGADVDSQELWIASILGDAMFSNMHGSTALSWMTLQGKKSDRTDLHSKTADTIGMSRDQAKVFNYGRIYGAGEKFAVRLLMQFNHNISLAQAEEKAAKLYATTKGIKSYLLTEEGLRLSESYSIPTSQGTISYINLKELLYLTKTSWENKELLVHKTWFGGSESDMFNKLESIAVSEEPRTPVLNCMITKALLPKYVHNHYMTSRVNWVVQSSAVDYLHLVLTCMKWLIEKYDIDARFCISIHDEVRYIVHEKDKYRAALALQISNLLTRALFAYKLQLNDLPQSVAFFSSVEIDKVLRKEVDNDCVTPSNPHGLLKGYGITPGESLDINELLRKTNNGHLHKMEI
ncbi:DNA polymerase subunit gamma-1 isoform X2 [Hydra vulgaris]|uniref:DNA-directed DNA polymerase n=1 Tax=Hydra vulgaris TaxID=6087 RepID=A0ABM4DED6_HYDVU